ncbi:MAG: class B sortase [Lachnospiraceae bacterium]|nr:class B sortase [Lachnospiraceae bacterium]
MIRFWKWLNGLYGWLMIVAFGFVMLIGIWQVYDNYYLFSHTIDDSVLKYKPHPREDDAPVEEQVMKGMVAWITIDGTNIDYPVMQADNNTYYLNIDPFGDYSLSGSIFLDCRCSSDLSDWYSMIYGHHMDYGKMFGALDEYLDEEYLRSHSRGTLIIGENAEEVCELEIFASMKVSSRERTVFDLDHVNIMRYIRDHAAVFTGEGEGRILALSTCLDAESSERIVAFCYVKATK